MEIYRETYYQRNRESYLARQKLYNRDHPDQIKEYQRQYWLTVAKPKMQSLRLLRPPKPKATKSKDICLPKPTVLWKAPEEIRKEPEIPNPPQTPVLPVLHTDEKTQPEPLPAILIQRGPIAVSFR